MLRKSNATTILYLDFYSLLKARPNEKNQYAKRLSNHTRSVISKVPPHEIGCFMESVADECYKGSPSVIPHLEKTIFTIYDTIKTGSDPFVKEKMNAQLISIFFRHPPTSLESKKKLLNAMADMKYLPTTHLSSSVILRDTAKDYIDREQHKEDPDFSFVSSLTKVIDVLAKGQTKHTVLTNQDRAILRKTLATLKKVTPETVKSTIENAEKQLKPVPERKRLGKTEGWNRTTFGEAAEAIRPARILKRDSYLL